MIGIKQIDYRLKLIASLIFIMISITNNKLSLLAINTSIIILLININKISIKKVVTRVYFALPFIVSFTVLIPFTTPGEVIWRNEYFITLSLTYEGSYISLVLILKLIISIFTMLVYSESTSMKEIYKGLKFIKIPSIIILIMSSIIIYFKLIHREFNRIIIAQKSRGLKKGKSIIDLEYYKNLGYVIGHVLFRTLDRSERVYKTMLSRGYKTFTIKQDKIIIKRDDIFFIVIFNIYILMVIGVYKI